MAINGRTKRAAIKSTNKVTSASSLADICNSEGVIRSTCYSLHYEFEQVLLSLNLLDGVEIFDGELHWRSLALRVGRRFAFLTLGVADRIRLNVQQEHTLVLLVSAISWRKKKKSWPGNSSLRKGDLIFKCCWTCTQKMQSVHLQLSLLDKIIFWTFSNQSKFTLSVINK